MSNSIGSSLDFLPPVPSTLQSQSQNFESPQIRGPGPANNTNFRSSSNQNLNYTTSTVMNSGHLSEVSFRGPMFQVETLPAAPTGSGGGAIINSG